MTFKCQRCAAPAPMVLITQNKERYINACYLCTSHWLNLGAELVRERGWMVTARPIGSVSEEPQAILPSRVALSFDYPALFARSWTRGKTQECVPAIHVNFIPMGE